MTDMDKEAEELKKALAELKLAGEDEFIITLGESVLSVSQAVSGQTEIIRGLMMVVDAAVTMSKINHERLQALEERAQGMSFEDMVDGKQLAPLGITPEHYEELRRANENMAMMTGFMRDST